MPLPTKVRKNSGVSGLAEVRVLDKSLRVIFQADHDTYETHKNGWDRESGLYNITLERTNDAIKFIAPPGRSEPYLVKFLEFGNRVGGSETSPGIPEPKINPGGTYPGKNGGVYTVPDQLVGAAKFVVVEKGKYKGLNISYRVPYIFELYPGSTIAMLVGTKAQNKSVEDFLRIVGNFDFANEEIPFSSNILPWLEARVQAANAVFSVQLNERGFVDKDGLRSIPSFLITPEMLGEEEAPVKKAKKPAAKAKAKAKK
jgi:hypothetical protein